MTITLPPELETLVSDRVADGTYASETDVLREALRLLEDRERRLQELREKVAVGVADSEAGRVSELSVEDIKRLARERLAS